MLERSVRAEDDKFRIGVELVDADSGKEIWAQHCERPETNIVEAQNEIVSKVVTTLGLSFKLENEATQHGQSIASRRQPMILKRSTIFSEPVNISGVSRKTITSRPANG
jgi:hypothetical protein